MLRFIESFDGYTGNTNLLARGWSGSNAPSAGQGRRGTAALQSNATRTIDSQSTWIIGFAWKNTTTTSSLILRLYASDGTIQCSLGWNADGTLSVYRSTSPVVATSSVVLGIGTYYYIEFKVTIANSIAADSCIVRVDGVPVINVAAGTDLQAHASLSTANQIQPGGNSAMYIDDLYIADGQAGGVTDFIGDCRVDCLLPNAAGSNNDFTPSAAAAHNTLVDEATPNGDTDYVESSTAGHRDSWNVANLPTLVNPIIKGVQLSLNAKKDDAGVRSIKNLCKSGATTNVGTAKALSTTYVYYHELYETDPNTAAAWTEANFNAAEFGAENV